MGTGTMVALALGGAAALGAAWYFTRPALPMQLGAPQQATAKPRPPAPPPPPPNAAQQLASGLSALNEAGCVAAASKVGAGQLAQMGCSTFLKYATPLGVAGLANDQLVKIPGVKSAESAVTQLASKPLDYGKSAYKAISSWL